MNYANKIFLAALVSLLVLSCKKKEQKTPQQMIEGKWIIETQELLGSTVSGDGSYLTFNACSGTCTGEDYKASDTTYGTFSYTLNEEGTLLTITDNSSNGGSWGATWDVLDLSETNLRITAATIFGNMTADFKR